MTMSKLGNRLAAAFAASLLIVAVSGCPTSTPQEAEYSSQQSYPTASDSQMDVGHFYGLSVDSLTGTFACESVKNYTGTLMCGTVIGSHAAVTAIDLPHATYVSPLPYFPICRSGLLVVLCHEGPGLGIRTTVQRYRFATQRWLVLLESAIRSGVGLTMPLAWSPGGDQFLYHDDSSLKAYDLHAEKKKVIADDVNPNARVYWPNAHSVYFSRKRGTLDRPPFHDSDVAAVLPFVGIGTWPGSLDTIDLFQIDLDTSHENQITDVPNLVGYAVNAEGNQVVLSAYSGDTGQLSLSLLTAEGLRARQLYMVPYMESNVQPSLGAGKVAVTLASDDLENPELLLGIGDIDGKECSVVHDDGGQLVRGRNPQFLTTRKLLFIGPYSSESRTTKHWRGMFENEWLYLYDLSTRAVTRVALDGAAGD